MAKNTRKYELVCQNQEQKDNIMTILTEYVKKTGKPRGQIILEALKGLRRDK